MLKCLAKKSEPRLMLSSCLIFCQNEPHHAYIHHAYKKKTCIGPIGLKIGTNALCNI